MTQNSPDEFSDEAKRMHNIVQGYLAFIDPWELKSKWLAVRLSDGGTDGTLYDSMEDAIRFQSDEFLCGYFSYMHCLGGVTVKECEIWLGFVRGAYNAGFRLPDPSAQFSNNSKTRLQPFMDVEHFDFKTGRDARTKR